MGSADTGAREPREVLRDYILSVPLAATDDDGSKKHAALNALAALAAGVGVPPDEDSGSALGQRASEVRARADRLLANQSWRPSRAHYAEAINEAVRALVGVEQDARGGYLHVDGLADDGTPL